MQSYFKHEEEQHGFFRDWALYNRNRNKSSERTYHSLSERSHRRRHSPQRKPRSPSDRTLRSLSERRCRSPSEEPLRVSLKGTSPGSLRGEVTVPQGGANPALLGEGLAVPQGRTLVVGSIVVLVSERDIILPPRIGSVFMGGTNTIPLFRDAAAPPKGAISVPSGGHGPVLQNGAMVLSLRDPLPDALAGQGKALLEEATAVPLGPGSTGLLPDSTAAILRELTTAPLTSKVTMRDPITAPRGGSGTVPLRRDPDIAGLKSSRIIELS